MIDRLMMLWVKLDQFVINWYAKRKGIIVQSEQANATDALAHMCLSGMAGVRWHSRLEGDDLGANIAVVDVKPVATQHGVMLLIVHCVEGLEHMPEYHREFPLHIFIQNYESTSEVLFPYEYQS